MVYSKVLGVFFLYIIYYNSLNNWLINEIKQLLNLYSNEPISVISNHKLLERN